MLLHTPVATLNSQSCSSFHPLPPHFLCCTHSNLCVVMLVAVLVRQEMREAALKHPSVEDAPIYTVYITDVPVSTALSVWLGIT